MKKHFFIILVLAFLCAMLFGCTDINEKALVYPEFEKFEETDNFEDQVYDVLSLDLSYGQIKYTDIGEVKDGKYILNGLYLPKSTCQTLDDKGDLKKGENEFTLTYNFYSHARYGDGIIIYKAVPFAYYIDNEGDAYIRCIDEKVRSEYGIDKTYPDFINWAKRCHLDDKDLALR